MQQVPGKKIKLEINKDWKQIKRKLKTCLPCKIMSASKNLKRCVVPYCMTVATKGFAAFPTDLHEKHVWRRLCGLPYVKPRALVCHSHFKDSCFVGVDRERRKLLKNSRPELRLPVVLHAPTQDVNGVEVLDQARDDLEGRNVIPAFDRKCVVCGAKGAKGFHTFPTSKAQRQKWLNHCNIESIKENDRICFRHFKSDDYFPRRSDDQLKRLKKFIVPSQNLPKRWQLNDYSKIGAEVNIVTVKEANIGDGTELVGSLTSTNEETSNLVMIDHSKDHNYILKEWPLTKQLELAC